MKPSTPAKWLDDIRDACSFIIEATSHRTEEDFENDRMLRQAVERNFEIIGEAMLRLERADEALAASIADHRAIIGLRNRLAHGYDDIDTSILWQIITQDVHALENSVTETLSRLRDQAVDETTNLDSGQTPMRGNGKDG